MVRGRHAVRFGGINLALLGFEARLTRRVPTVPTSEVQQYIPYRVLQFRRMSTLGRLRFWAKPARLKCKGTRLDINLGDTVSQSHTNNQATLPRIRQSISRGGYAELEANASHIPQICIQPPGLARSGREVDAMVSSWRQIPSGSAHISAPP